MSRLNVGRRGAVLLITTLAALGGGVALAAGTASAQNMSCLSARQCTLLASDTSVVTFNPTHKGKLDKGKISDNDVGAALLACGSTHACVAASANGDYNVFDPTHSGSIGVTGTLKNPAASAIDCPSAHECVIVGTSGEAVIDPAHPKSASSSPFAANANAGDISLSCPSNAFCAETLGNQDVVTFNPSKPGAAKSVTLDKSKFIDGISCPSSTQCTMLGSPTGSDNSNEAILTINPRSPNPKARARTLFDSSIEQIVCPSKKICVAGGNSDGIYAFNPLTGKKHFAAMPYDYADPGSSLDVAALACVSAKECVAYVSNGEKTVVNPAKLPKTLKVYKLDKSA